jgi:hypothetical protein
MCNAALYLNENALPPHPVARSEYARVQKYESYCRGEMDLDMIYIPRPTFATSVPPMSSR